MGHQFVGEAGVDPCLHGHSPARCPAPGTGTAGTAGHRRFRVRRRGACSHVLSSSYKSAEVQSLRNRRHATTWYGPCAYRVVLQKNYCTFPGRASRRDQLPVGKFVTESDRLTNMPVNRLPTRRSTEAPVHEPVHDHHSERLMSTTERHHAPREIRSVRQRLLGAGPALARRSGRYVSPKGAMTFDHPNNADERASVLRANVEFCLVVASGWRTLLAAAAGRSVRGPPCR